MEITIRSVSESDFPQLIDLFKEFAIFEKHPDKMVNSIERMMQEKEFFNCFVAETNDGKIIGYATYFYSYYTWSGKSLYMDDLYVTPNFRAKGIGSQLINKVIDFARTSNCHKVRWQVSRWNQQAIGFYNSLGATIDDVEWNCDLLLSR